MRFGSLARALGLLGVLLSGTAFAAEGDGLRVGLSAAAGELGGMVVGGAVGGGLGAAGCWTSNGWECYLPLLTAPVGGAVGGIGGATWAGQRRAEALGLDDRRVRRWTLATGLAGLAVSTTGLVAESYGLMYGGAALGVVGMPVAAGLAANGRETARGEAPERGLRVALTPTVGLGQVGLHLDGSF